MPAAAKSSMHATANRISDIDQRANKGDMAHICEDIKKVQYAPGQNAIDVDARYSNQTHSGISNTPYQAATQMTQLVPENLTKDKKIIACNIQSKLCQVCALARTESRVLLPPHRCTASLDATDPIGNERLRAREMIADLANDGIIVNIVTTDTDSSAFVVSRVTKKMSLVRSNLLQNYSGVHTLCRKHSFVCEGKNANNWIMR